jgi:hypothetical protein
MRNPGETKEPSEVVTGTRATEEAATGAVGGGVLGGLTALVGGPIGAIAALVCFLGSAILPAVWSLLYARRQDPS